MNGPQTDGGPFTPSSQGWRVYLSEIHLLTGQDARRLPWLFVINVLLALIDLIGIGLLGQFVALVLGIEPSASIPFSGWLHGFSSSSWKVGGVGAVLVAVFCVKAYLGIHSYYLIYRTVGHIEANLRSQLLLRYQMMPYQDWMRRNSSEYINSVNVWTTQYTRFVLIPLIRLSADTLLAVMILSFLAFVSPVAFLLFFLLTVGTALVYDRMFKKRNQAYARSYRDLSTQVITDVRHALDGFKEIRVLGAEKSFNSHIQRNASALCAAMAHSNTISQAPRFLIEVAVVLVAVLILLLTVYSGSQPAALMPVFAMFGAGAARLMTLISLASSTVTNLRLYRAAIHQLAVDYRIPVEPGLEADTSNPGQFLNLQTDGLGFRYLDSQRDALRDVNIEINAGECVAIVGPSGSGKSTLVDLLLGILHPTQGRVLVHTSGGTGSADYLRRQAAYLPQGVFLIDDTLRQNVALGESGGSIDNDRVVSALRRAHLADLVDSLPDGLDTRVGDRGARLSGGQKQRIALARAFYLGRRVLVFDEATSAIDYQTEQAILDDLLSMRGEITLIVITHRVDVTKRFDRVFLVNNGSVESPGRST